MSFLSALRDFFGWPSSEVPEEEDFATEEREAPLRNALEDARPGDTFAGVYGGVRHFLGFDSSTGEALFTRANRPQILREHPEKWALFLKTATVVSLAPSANGTSGSRTVRNP